MSKLSRSCNNYACRPLFVLYNVRKAGYMSPRTSTAVLLSRNHQTDVLWHNVSRNKLF